jgi:gluconokinase
MTMPVFVIMGVSGCGKTTVGQALAQKLACPFFDGDDFHPPENVAKMGNGIPLTDADRIPWLATLHDLLAEYVTSGNTAVLACSALKKKYRQQLRDGNDNIVFVNLHGEFDLIWQRMKTRPNHYMKADMPQSQFDTLEVPADNEALTLPITLPIAAIITTILDQYSMTTHNIDVDTS